MEKIGSMRVVAVLLSFASAVVFSSCLPVAKSGSNKRYEGGESATENGSEKKGTDKSDKSKKKKEKESLSDKNDDLDESGIVFEHQVDEKEEAASDCHKADEEICALEKQVFELTNRLRKEEGKAPLKLSPELSWAARQWSTQMSKLGIISHLGFPGSRQSDFLSEFGSSPSMSAENVAMNYTDVGNVASGFFEMWESSSGHRINMLSNNGSIGVGIAKNSRGAWYATQIFGR